MAGTSVNISFGLVDVEAKQDTTATASEQQSFIDVQDLALEGVSAPKAATLEKNYWKLDGTFRVFPDNPEDTTWGLWSKQMSGEGGSFETPITLTLSFSAYHESIGLTFEFNPHDNSYCNNLNIKWYQGNTLLYDLNFTPDKWNYSCTQTVENYDRIVITFYSMNKPYRYLKVQNIMHGILQEFKEALKSADIYEETDISGLTLSINTLDFVVYSEDDRFNIFNPEGVYTLLQKKQQLTVTGTSNDTMMNMGIFYVDEMEAQSDKLLSISAVDGIGIMDGTSFKGGIYSNKLVSELIEEIMTDAGFGYTLDAALSAKTVSGYIPICSHRQALQYVVFAAGGFVTTARSGAVNIKALPDLSNEPSVTIGRDRKFTGTKVKLRTLVTGVNITAHNYKLNSTAEEICTVNLGIGDNEVTFSEPCADISVSCGTIKESGTNYCIIAASEKMECIVSGKKYTDNTKVAGVKMPNLPAGEKENIIEADCTMVDSSNALQVAQNLFNYYQYRIEQNLSFVMKDENTGALADIETEYGVYRGSIIESMDTSLTGGFVTKAVTIGE